MAPTNDNQIAMTGAMRGLAGAVQDPLPAKAAAAVA
jgi:hypothetical protein